MMMEDSDILTLGWGCEAPPTSGLWSHTHGGGGGGPEEFVTLEESQTYARTQAALILPPSSFDVYIYLKGVSHRIQVGLKAFVRNTVVILFNRKAGFLCELLTANAVVATVLGSILSSSDTVERQMKHC
jgi:hypothetical protein